MIIQLLIYGLAAGAVYSLVALGFALIYQTTRGKATPLELLPPPSSRYNSSGLPPSLCFGGQVGGAGPCCSSRDEVSIKVGHFAHGAVYTFGAYASIPLKAGLSTSTSTTLSTSFACLMITL